MSTTRPILKGAVSIGDAADGESDYYFIEANEAEQALGRILEPVRQRIPNALILIPFAIFKFSAP